MEICVKLFFLLNIFAVIGFLVVHGKSKLNVAI